MSDNRLETKSEPDHVINERPAYTQRKKPLKTQTIAGEERSPIFQNMQVRLVIHMLGICILTLFALGIGIVSSGMWQVHRAEISHSKAILDNLNRFAKSHQVADPDYSTEELLWQYMSQQNPTPDSALLGFIGKDLRIHQGKIGIPAHTDEELLEKISKKYSSDRSSLFMIKTTRTLYTVATIPVSVSGSQAGFLAVVYDHNANNAPIFNLINLYLGISLLVLTLVALIGFRTSRAMLRPLKRMRLMMSSINNQKDLDKRLPESGSDDLAVVAREANNMIHRLQLAFEKERDLLNDIGHELRTPITVIRGHLELMDPIDPEDTVKTRKLALEELDRMHRLTEDLITVAKTNRPDFIQLSAVNLEEFIVDTFEHAQQLGPFQWNIDAICLACAKIDPQRLQQAILQLCQNATKFSESGNLIAIGAELNADPQLLDQHGEIVPTELVTAPKLESQKPYDFNPDDEEHLTVWVRDRGIGIEPKNQKRVFDRFARVEHSIPGSGLGLSIVNAITQAHHGKLSLRSKPGYGSVFIIRIPIRSKKAE